MIDEDKLEVIEQIIQDIDNEEEPIEDSDEIEEVQKGK